MSDAGDGCDRRFGLPWPELNGGLSYDDGSTLIEFYGSKCRNLAPLQSGHLKPRHPLPGDCGYFLHAHQLILFHAMTDEVLTITALLPSILQTQEALDSSNLTME